MSLGIHVSAVVCISFRNVLREAQWQQRTLKWNYLELETGGGEVLDHVLLMLWEKAKRKSLLCLPACCLASHMRHAAVSGSLPRCQMHTPSFILGRMNNWWTRTGYKHSIHLKYFSKTIQYQVIQSSFPSQIMLSVPRCGQIKMFWLQPNTNIKLQCNLMQWADISFSFAGLEDNKSKE